MQLTNWRIEDFAGALNICDSKNECVCYVNKQELVTLKRDVDGITFEAKQMIPRENAERAAKLITQAPAMEALLVKIGRRFEEGSNTKEEITDLLIATGCLSGNSAQP